MKSPALFLQRLAAANHSEKECLTDKQFAERHEDSAAGRLVKSQHCPSQLITVARSRRHRISWFMPSPRLNLQMIGCLHGGDLQFGAKRGCGKLKAKTASHRVKNVNAEADLYLLICPSCYVFNIPTATECFASRPSLRPVGMLYKRFLM